MLNYLHPLKERVRVMLRLEQLFKYIIMANESPTFNESLSYLGLESLVHIVNLSARYDINMEVGKELERIDTALNSAEIKELLSNFYDNKAAQGLRHNEFLNHLKQKLTLLGPAYHIDYHRLGCWLNPNSKMRQKDFEYWVMLLSPLIQANRAIIKAYQDASIVKSLAVEKGFCQFTVPRTTCLLSVSIGNYPVYPEFSGNQYRMTIRLLSEVSGNDRPIQSMLSGNIHLKVCEI